MSGKPKTLRDLQRTYRQERALLLEDRGLSWEAKMRATRELFERYRARQAEIEMTTGEEEAS